MLRHYSGHYGGAFFSVPYFEAEIYWEVLRRFQLNSRQQFWLGWKIGHVFLPAAPWLLILLEGNDRRLLNMQPACISAIAIWQFPQWTHTWSWWNFPSGFTHRIHPAAWIRSYFFPCWDRNSLRNQNILWCVLHLSCNGNANHVYNEGALVQPGSSPSIACLLSRQTGSENRRWGNN